MDVLLPRDTGPFTYLLPEGRRSLIPVPGTRIRVPFRTGLIWGVVWGRPDTTPSGKIRIREAVDLDGDPLLTPAQIELLRWTAAYYLRSPGLVLRTMCPPGLLEGKKTRAARIAPGPPPEPSPSPHRLSDAQRKALDAIASTGKKPVVLFGVTGSGKTEVYLRAIAALPTGRGALVLVPEISLTTQTAERFLQRFGSEVMILHSGLSDGERLHGWRQLRQGSARIALGTRSAVFAPFRDLGLVIVDEEHSQTYKQEEGLRYHARDLAVVRGMIEGATVVLGSATPSIETWHNAEKGKYSLALLPDRVRERPPPEVRLLDIRGRKEREGPVSRELVVAIDREIRAGNQAMVLLNRRGYAPSVVCTDCGHHWTCPQCTISLTFHKRSNRLRCHYCGSTSYPPSRCPSCGGAQNRPVGIGTEKLEEAFLEHFSEGDSGCGVAIRRMDLDTTRKKLSHGRIIRSVEQREVQLLLGTQMVAKGHDLPGVTVGGVVSADDALNLPDFRAPEKAFQLLHQFAGRTGRGERPGTVYIETRNPEHSLYAHVVSGDYPAFCKEEMNARKQLGYPPFGFLIRIILSARSRAELDGVLDCIERIPQPAGNRKTEILGPVPCPLERVRGRLRYHLLLKGATREEVRQVLSVLLARIGKPKGVKIDVDIDPVQMM